MSNLVPDWLLNNARGEKAVAEREIQQARERIPAQYHDFLLLLDQNVKLFGKQFDMSPEARKIGMWSSQNGVYVTISKPYVTVDGRVQMARDDHREKDGTLDIGTPVIEEICGRWVCSVEAVSSIYGKSVGTIEIGISDDNSKGNPVDKAYPISNAQTSAIGRALGFMGYGLVGTGLIASAEEMKGVIEQEDKPPVDQAPPPSTSNKPESHRLKVLKAPTFKTDGASEVECMAIDSSTVKVVFAKENKAFVQTLKKETVFQVVGWRNNDRIRTTKATPTIEQAV